MKVIVDRFEGDYAVVELENMEMCNVPKILIPDAKEGDIISIDILKDETEIQKEKIENLANKLFQ